MIEDFIDGVPRSLIPWYPTVNYDKCTNCGSCVNFCTAGGFGVFAFEKKNGKNVVVVKNPNNCIVYCRGCEAKEVCPVGAISHQTDEETINIIEKLQKSVQKKDL